MAHLPASNSVDEDLEDPWLTASDLFGAGAEAISDPPNPPYEGGQQSTPNISRLQNRGIQRISPRFSREVRKLDGAKNTTGKKILSPFSRRIGGIAGANSSKINPHDPRQQLLQKAKTNNIAKSAAEDSSVQPTPDWIETRATLMGYVKHPLEQILAWLDRAMLWLEETLLKFWQWLQKMWRKL
jgi:hypothetical protein